ncbi:hypothetical protein PR048_029174 [Dryococelus australis]|uniref:Uncharacterized protein n=1 Tax=Dryococelus australis TaxID=614101 RepID=A0ABQ9GF61_9NEOP|nr:hypothetical protein PR048_029174 [Dryococelus australis]
MWHLPARLVQPSSTLGGHGAERLAYSPPTKAIRAQSPAGSLRIFACGNRAGRRCWSAGFLGDIPLPRPFIPALLSHPHRLSRPRCYEMSKSLHSLTLKGHRPRQESATSRTCVSNKLPITKATGTSAPCGERLYIGHNKLEERGRRYWLLTCNYKKIRRMIKRRIALFASLDNNATGYTGHDGRGPTEIKKGGTEKQKRDSTAPERTRCGFMGPARAGCLATRTACVLVVVGKGKRPRGCGQLHERAGESAIGEYARNFQAASLNDASVLLSLLENRRVLGQSYDVACRDEIILTWRGLNKRPHCASAQGRADVLCNSLACVAFLMPQCIDIRANRDRFHPHPSLSEQLLPSQMTSLSRDVERCYPTHPPTHPPTFLPSPY